MSFIVLSGCIYTLPYGNVVWHAASLDGMLQQFSDHAGLHVITSYIAVVVYSSLTAYRYGDIAGKFKHTLPIWCGMDSYCPVF